MVKQINGLENIMKQLLLLDAKNYNEDMDEYVRIAVRGIIFDGDISDNKFHEDFPEMFK